MVGVFGVWVKASIEIPPLVSRSPFPQDAEGAGSSSAGKRPGIGGAAGKRGIPGLSVTEGFQERLIPFSLCPFERLYEPLFEAPAGEEREVGEIQPHPQGSGR